MSTHTHTQKIQAALFGYLILFQISMHNLLEATCKVDDMYLSIARTIQAKMHSFAHTLMKIIINLNSPVFTFIFNLQKTSRLKGISTIFLEHNKECWLWLIWLAKYSGIWGKYSCIWWKYSVVVAVLIRFDMSWSWWLGIWGRLGR